MKKLLVATAFLQGADTRDAQIHQAIGERKEFKTTILNYRKDGQPFWNELKISPVFSDEGELLYLSVFRRTPKPGNRTAQR